MSFELDSTDLKAAAQILDHFEEIAKVLVNQEAWIVFPVSVNSELVGGLNGVIDYHESGALVFKPSDGGE